MCRCRVDATTPPPPPPTHPILHSKGQGGYTTYYTRLPSSVNGARPVDFQPGEFVAKVNVYIDGFNLYYGALKGTPYKWLDLGRLCQALLPSDTIQEIKYFTARVSARPARPSNATSARDQGL